MTTARYREVRPCEPGYCYLARLSVAVEPDGGYEPALFEGN